MSLHAVVLAGGVGSRLWPVSSPDRPKQVQSLFAEVPLVQLAIERGERFAPGRTWVVTDADVEPKLRAILPAVAPDRFIVEPARRGTLAAVVVAAIAVAANDPDAVLVFLPADHLCDQPEVLADAIGLLADHLPSGGVGLVGTPVHEINPQLGHFGLGPTLAANTTGGEVAEVHGYVEKPDHLDDVGGGRWFANLGLVVVAAATVSQLAGDAIMRVARDVVEERPGATDRWRRLPVQRIEDVVLPVADRLVGVAAPIDWVDVGTWATLADSARDGGSLRSGPVEATGIDRCVAVSTDRPVHLIGVADLVVVATADRVIVCHRDHLAELDALRSRLLCADGEETGR